MQQQGKFLQVILISRTLGFLEFSFPDLVVRIMGWLYKCEQFFEVDNIADNIRVKVACILLTGKALL